MPSKRIEKISTIQVKEKTIALPGVITARYQNDNPTFISVKQAYDRLLSGEIISLRGPERGYEDSYTCISQLFKPIAENLGLEPKAGLEKKIQGIVAEFGVMPLPITPLTMLDFSKLAKFLLESDNNPSRQVKVNKSILDTAKPCWLTEESDLPYYSLSVVPGLGITSLKYVLAQPKEINRTNRSEVLIPASLY